MKKYIGTKTASAEPMTYREAHMNGLILKNAYVEEYNECPGYLVIYEDGYKSWSPAEVFEAAYKVAESALDRVNIEDVELREKIAKLSDFILTDSKFKELSRGTQAMLIAQLHSMSAYSNLLSMRQSCMEDGVDCQPYMLSFEQILPLLREGYAIRRNGWNGKGLMVFKQVPAHITSEIIPKMQSLPDEAKRLVLAHGDHIDYTCQCLIFNPETGRADSWVPSISDVFANDWELVTD